MSASRGDVLVLGGGAVGLACALFLLRAGRAVTVLEAGAVGGGSSHGNCGTITPSHLPLHAPGTWQRGLRSLLEPDAPLRIKPRLDPALIAWLAGFARRCNRRDFHATAAVKAELLQASRMRLEQLIGDEKLDCEFQRSGTLYVWRTERAFEKALADFRVLQELGIPVERLDGAAARAREPALNASIVGGHLHPGDARLRPDRYVAELARVLRQAGGMIEEQTRVEGFRLENGRVVSVRAGARDYRADEIVYALGAWSPPLARQLGLDLPIQPGKGYSITYTRPQQAPVIPLVLKERSVCVTSWASGYRLGSTLEFAGYDSTLNRRRLDALARGAAEYLHEPVGAQVEEEWCGWRPMTPDDLPILGRAPKLANLTLATGHGMLGISLSAITGQLLAELLSHRTPGLDLAPYSITRFS
jgi:D-amino-acid dehydrogenase